MKWLAEYVRDCAKGVKVLCSHAFWLAFRDYWAPSQVAARIDAFAARLRPTDPPV